MFIRVTCYLPNVDKLPEETRKELYNSDGNTSCIEREIELNTNYIMYLEESYVMYYLGYNKEKEIKCKTVIATMTNGKQFYIKCDSIYELKMLASIKDGVCLE